MEEYNYPLYVQSAGRGFKSLIYEFVLRRARPKSVFSSTAEVSSTVLIFDGATQIGTASGDSPPTHA
ncbi:MAG: hypothetical protein WBP84_04345 [Nitrososphaeraceae archaeon]